MSKRCIGAAAVLAAALLAGCSPPPPTIVAAQGVVTINGVPLPRALRVRFVPTIDRASEYMAQGVTDDQGRFTVTCHGQAGACAAENLVTVSEDDIPEQLTPESRRAELQAYLGSLQNRPIPPAYANLATSPLKLTLDAGRKEYPIELSR